MNLTRIEKPYYDNGQLKLSVISKAQEFIYRFGAGIAPSTKGGRTEEAVVLFLEWNIAIFSVYL